MDSILPFQTTLKKKNQTPPSLPREGMCLLLIMLSDIILTTLLECDFSPRNKEPKFIHNLILLH